MDILALDLGAYRTGWSRGRAGQIPVSDSWKLRKPKDETGLACGDLARHLRDHKLEAGIPDLVLIEHWMPPKASRSGAATEDSLRLNGVVHGLMGGIYGCRIIEPYQNTVRSQVCGRAFDPGGDTKGMVLRTAILLGLLPAGCDDHDRADSLLLWRYAEANFARVPPKEFALVPR